MERWLRASGFLFAVLVVMTAVTIGVGSRLPEEHVATATATVAAPEARVWELLTDLPAQTGWRTGLRAVDGVTDGSAGPCWREVRAWTALPLCVTESVAPAEGRPGRRVVEVADVRLPFGGRWTYEVERQGPEQTRVTVTERGRTVPAMWRFMGRYVSGEDTEVRRFLGELQAAAERKS